jgi:hypothetical protein
MVTEQVVMVADYMVAVEAVVLMILDLQMVHT